MRTTVAARHLAAGMLLVEGFACWGSGAEPGTADMRARLLSRCLLAHRPRQPNSLGRRGRCHPCQQSHDALRFRELTPAPATLRYVDRGRTTRAIEKCPGAVGAAPRGRRRREWISIPCSERWRPATRSDLTRARAERVLVNVDELCVNKRGHGGRSRRLECALNSGRATVLLWWLGGRYLGCWTVGGNNVAAISLAALPA
jgi:hypothetical protein